MHGFPVRSPEELTEFSNVNQRRQYSFFLNLELVVSAPTKVKRLLIAQLQRVWGLPLLLLLLCVCCLCSY